MLREQIRQVHLEYNSIANQLSAFYYKNANLLNMHSSPSGAVDSTNTSVWTAGSDKPYEHPQITQISQDVHTVQHFHHTAPPSNQHQYYSKPSRRHILCLNNSAEIQRSIDMYSDDSMYEELSSISMVPPHEPLVESSHHYSTPSTCKTQCNPQHQGDNILLHGAPHKYPHHSTPRHKPDFSDHFNIDSLVDAEVAKCVRRLSFSDDSAGRLSPAPKEPIPEWQRPVQLDPNTTLAWADKPSMCCSTESSSYNNIDFSFTAGCTSDCKPVSCSQNGPIPPTNTPRCSKQSLINTTNGLSTDSYLKDGDGYLMTITDIKDMHLNHTDGLSMIINNSHSPENKHPIHHSPEHNYEQIIYHSPEHHYEQITHHSSNQMPSQQTTTLGKRPTCIGKEASPEVSTTRGQSLAYDTINSDATSFMDRPLCPKALTRNHQHNKKTLAKKLQKISRIIHHHGMHSKYLKNLGFV